MTTTDKMNGSPACPQKDKVIWSTSELGKDDVKSIRKEITLLTEKFLKARAGK